jgi:4-amino-4-deoxy-L-arabinose transferase-like glycosyltransferase
VTTFPLSRTGRARRPSPDVLAGLGLALVSAVIYWLCNRSFDAGRGDFFYLADAFLHGRTWLDMRPGLNDVILIDGRTYVPFAPFPAIALMPLVAVIGPVSADIWESGINAVLAGAGVGMCWWLLGRMQVPRTVDRVWITLLFGFSTQILWVTTRGGVWHTGHLIATLLTFACLIELWGRQRAWLIGLLAGAAFLTRAPLAFAVPFYALMLDASAAAWGARARVAGGYVATVARSIPWRQWFLLGAGVFPSIAFFFLYNQLRFDTPLESGYALATLPSFLEELRQKGLFGIAHVPMNLDYLFFHLPRSIPDFPFFRPDGLGMSILVTSPGLFYALRADWRSRRAWLLLGAAVAVLIPTLLYYGGGWLQYGYRYFLDSVPFVIALCGLAAAHRGRVGIGWKALIAFGVLVMALGVYWAYRI